MKWEYKIVYINAKEWTSTGLPNNLNEQFDKYGEEGWELVKIKSKLRGGIFVFFMGRVSLTEGYVAFFKRKLEF